MATKRADALVIGGGIVGLSVAWQLTELGVARALAESIVWGRAETIDLDRLGPDRFERPADAPAAAAPTLL